MYMHCLRSNCWSVNVANIASVTPSRAHSIMMVLFIGTTLELQGKKYHPVQQSCKCIVPSMICLWGRSCGGNVWENKMTVLVGVWSIQLLQWCVPVYIYIIWVCVCVWVCESSVGWIETFNTILGGEHPLTSYFDHAVQRHRNLHFSRETLPIFVARKWKAVQGISTG